MPFEFIALDLPEVLLIEPRVFSDERGFFMETYKRSEFSRHGIDEFFVQGNHSHSSKGTLRGLHFQKAPKAQGKLIRVVFGAIFDVVVDIRKGSPRFGRWVGVEIIRSEQSDALCAARIRPWSLHYQRGSDVALYGHRGIRPGV